MASKPDAPFQNPVPPLSPMEPGPNPALPEPDEDGGPDWGDPFPAQPLPDGF